MLKAKEEVRQKESSSSSLILRDRREPPPVSPKTKQIRNTDLPRSSSSFSGKTTAQKNNLNLQKHSSSTSALIIAKRASLDMYQSQDSEEESHYQNFSIINNQLSQETSDSTPQLNSFTNNNVSKLTKSATLPSKKISIEIAMLWSIFVLQILHMFHFFEQKRFLVDYQLFCEIR